MPLFSVIIPHYNSVSLLKQLLESIPVDEAIQVIVVDDKSTECLAGIENQVTSRGGIFLHNTTDKKGAGTCRNIGLAQATGKWLVFADADDYFLDGAFDVMRRHVNSGADIVHFIPTSVDMETGEISTRHTWCEKLVQRYLADPVEENELMLRYRFMVPWSKMVRCKMVKDAGIFFDEVIAANDIMFSAKCGYCAKTVEAFADKIYCVTKSRGTLTTRHDENAYRARAIVHRNKYKFLKEHIDLKKYGYVVPMGIRILEHAARQGYSMKFVYEIYRYFRREHVAMINIATLRYTFRHMMRRKAV